MHKLAIASVLLGSTVSLFLMIACSSQDPVGDIQMSPPTLVSLALQQMTIKDGDSAFLPSPVPFSPEVFDPDSLRYAARPLAGQVAVIPDAPSHHAISVYMADSEITADRIPDGRARYLVDLTADTEIEVVVRDSAGGQNIYHVFMQVQPLTEQGLPSLKVMALTQTFYNRSVIYSTRVLSPIFHPDSLRYTAEVDSSVQPGTYDWFEWETWCAVPDDGVGMKVTLNDSLTQPYRSSGDTAFFAFKKSPSSRFKATVKDSVTGKSRTYVLSIAPRIQLGSKEWSALPDLPSSPFEVDFVDRSIGFAMLKTSFLYKTMDGGTTWVKLPRPNGFAGTSPGRIDFEGPDTGFVLYPGGFLFGTTDGGYHWKRLPMPPEGDIFQFPTAKNGYVGSDRSIFRTIDGGSNWTETSLDFHLHGMNFTGPLRGFIYGDKGKVLETRDGGGTWVNLSANLDTARQFSSFFVPEKNCLFVSDAVDLFRSVDGGRSWQVANLPIDYGRVQDLAFTDSRTGFVILEGYGGTFNIRKTGDAGQSWQFQDGASIFFRWLKFPEADFGYLIGANGELFKSSR